MELTILRQTARRGRLDARLHDNHTGNTATSQLASILEPDNGHYPVPPHIMSDLEIANAHATATRLDQRHYGSLLEYVNSMGMEYCSAYENIPQVRGTLILPPLAHHLRQVNLDSRTYSIKESHVGNSHIQFYIPGAVGGTIDTGYIEAIWELPLERVHQFFFLFDGISHFHQCSYGKHHMHITHVQICKQRLSRWRIQMIFISLNNGT